MAQCQKALSEIDEHVFLFKLSGNDDVRRDLEHYREDAVIWQRVWTKQKRRLSNMRKKVESKNGASQAQPSTPGETQSPIGMLADVKLMSSLRGASCSQDPLNPGVETIMQNVVNFPVGLSRSISCLDLSTPDTTTSKKKKVVHHPYIESSSSNSSSNSSIADNENKDLHVETPVPRSRLQATPLPEQSRLHIYEQHPQQHQQQHQHQQLVTSPLQRLLRLRGNIISGTPSPAAQRSISDGQQHVMPLRITEAALRMHNHAEASVIPADVNAKSINTSTSGHDTSDNAARLSTPSNATGSSVAMSDPVAPAVPAIQTALQQPQEHCQRATAELTRKQPVTSGDNNGGDVFALPSENDALTGTVITGLAIARQIKPTAVNLQFKSTRFGNDCEEGGDVKDADQSAQQGTRDKKGKLTKGPNTYTAYNIFAVSKMSDAFFHPDRLAWDRGFVLWRMHGAEYQIPGHHPKKI